MSRIRLVLLLVGLAVAVLVVRAAGAHTTMTGLVRVVVDGPRMSYALSVVASEIPQESAAALSAASGGSAAAAEAVAKILRRSVSIAVDGIDCTPGRVRLQESRVAEGRALLELDFACPREPGRLRLREDWQGWLGEHYGSLVSLQKGGASREFRLDKDTPEQSVTFDASLATGWLDFVTMGIEHILGGIDHLLFLLALLAPARRLWSVIRIATAFTVAHSLTLSLAVLGWIEVPSAIVEPLIAASIVAVAAENLLTAHESRWRWVLAFVFGLVHGLGFAGALTELDLTTASLVRALVGFNIGVEIGQLLAIAVAFPLLYWAGAPQRWPWLAKGLSLVVLLAGAWWLVERTLLA